MRKALLVLTLLTGIAFYYATANANPELTANMATTQDVDPYDVLKPGESLEAKGRQIVNTSSTDIRIMYCPGKGERCEVSVTVKGVKVTYREEKGVNNNAVEVKW